MESPPCDCPVFPRLRGELRTSFTETNPGRRFFGCPKYDPELEGGGTEHCGFFRWFDRRCELPEHISALILGLKGDNRHQRRNGVRLLAENERLRREMAARRFNCGNIVVVVFLFLLGFVIGICCSGSGKST